MSSFEIDVTNDEELCLKLQKAPKQIRTQTVMLVGQDFKNKVEKEFRKDKAKTSIPETTNAYQIDNSQASNGKVIVYSDRGKYMKWAEEGRGPIHAKPGKVLAFELRKNCSLGEKGDIIYRKSVGPWKGRQDIPTAINQVEPRIQGLFQKACQRVKL